MTDVNADDYLSKPFSSHDMLEKVHLWLKKPLIHSESSIVSMEHSTPPEPKTQFEFGHPYRQSIPNGISPNIYMFKRTHWLRKIQFISPVYFRWCIKAATMHATIF